MIHVSNLWNLQDRAVESLWDPFFFFLFFPLSLFASPFLVFVIPPFCQTSYSVYLV
jgi:hypothetical protein